MPRAILVVAALAAAASSVDAFLGGPALPALRPQRHVALGAPGPRVAKRSLMRMAEWEDEPAKVVVEEEEKVEAPAKKGSNQMKIKVDKSGAGFNQFDPVRGPTPHNLQRKDMLCRGNLEALGCGDALPPCIFCHTWGFCVDFEIACGTLFPCSNF